jgi:hypothetical protein
MMSQVMDNLIGYIHHYNGERKIHRYVIAEVLVVMQLLQVLFVVVVLISATMEFLAQMFRRNI